MFLEIVEAAGCLALLSILGRLIVSWGRAMVCFNFHGLKMAKDLGFKQVQVEMDSSVVV